MGYQPGYRKKRLCKEKKIILRKNRQRSLPPLKAVFQQAPATSRRISYQTRFYSSSSLARDSEKARRGCLMCCVIDEQLPTRTHSHASNLSVYQDPGVFSGIGAGRSAIRWLNDHPRRYKAEPRFDITLALDSNEGGRNKTGLYNATLCAERDEVPAQKLSIESPVFLKQAISSSAFPLLVIASPPCTDLSCLGKQDGIINGQRSKGAFSGLFAYLEVTSPNLLIIEEVDSLLTAPNKASFQFLTRNLEHLQFHWRLRILDAADYGSAQQRLRVFIVCAKRAVVLDNFTWPRKSHKRIHTFDESMEITPDEENLSLAIGSRVGRLLVDPECGLQTKDQRVFSNVGSVYRDKVSVLAKRRKSIPTITASRGSSLYVLQGGVPRRLSGKDALRFFTFSDKEVDEYGAAAKRLGISSARLAEYTGDCYVVIVMAQIVRRLADAYIDEIEEACDGSSL